MSRKAFVIEKKKCILQNSKQKIAVGNVGSQKNAPRISNVEDYILLSPIL